MPSLLTSTFFQKWKFIAHFLINVGNILNDCKANNNFHESLIHHETEWNNFNSIFKNNHFFISKFMIKNENLSENLWNRQTITKR